MSCSTKTSENALSSDVCLFQINLQDYTDLRDKVKEALSCVKADFIPTICRGREILCYHDTSDGLMKEYDFNK